MTNCKKMNNVLIKIYVIIFMVLIFVDYVFYFTGEDIFDKPIYVEQPEYNKHG